MTSLWWRVSGWKRDFRWAFTAAVGVTIAILAAVTTYGVYVVRADADAARLALAQEGEMTPTTTGVVMAFDDAPGQGQFSVVTLYPGGPGAPMPPGIPEHLQPGDVALSPGLLDLPASQRIEERYGRFAATISQEGLGAPDEKLAYIIGEDRPPSTMVVPRFGGAQMSPWQVATNSATFGESLTIMGLNVALPGLLGLISLPGLGIAWACAQRGVARRKRRDMTLEALGASPRARLALKASSAAPGAVAGAAMVTAAWWGWIQTTPTVPFVSFAIAPSALPLSWAAGCAVLSALVGVSLFSGSRSRRWLSTRPTRRPRPVDPRWIVAGPIAVAAASWLPSQLAGTNGLVYALLNWGLAALSVPAVAVSVAVATAATGAALSRLGSRRGSGTLLLSGASLGAASRHAVVLTFALGALSGVAFHSAQAALTTQSISVDARRINAAVGTNVALAEIPTSQVAEAFLADLPDEVGAVAVSAERLTGRCDDLDIIGVPCDVPGATTSRGAAILAALSLPETTTAHEGNPPAGAGHYLIVSRNGHPVDVPSLKSEIYGHAGLTTPVGPVANWSIASEGMAHQARWVVVWSVVGLSLGLLGLFLAASGTQADHSRRLAPVIALFGTHRARTSLVVGITTVVPLLIGGFASVGAHTVEAASLLGRIKMPGALNPLALGLMAVIVVGSVIASLVATWRTASAAASWTPGSDS